MGVERDQGAERPRDPPVVVMTLVGRLPISSADSVLTRAVSSSLAVGSFFRYRTSTAESGQYRGKLLGIYTYAELGYHGARA